MTLTLTSLLVLLLIAAVCGYVAKALVGVASGGLITTIILGFIGALLGPWLASRLNLGEPFMVNIGGESFPILWSIIGAAVFVALLHLLSGRGWRRV
jgi:uncharacterized membrane protein YeaQ/YmgE (transglycosylase-associated protein family)